MRINKKIMICVLLLCLVTLLCPRHITNATTGLVPIEKSSGGNLTYRGSSEVVYRLEEYNYPTNQLRAVWVSPFVGDIPRYSNESQFKTAVTELLDDMVSMGMNAIVYHVRTHNNAMYKSELNPLASWWANVDFDSFDPLTYFIEESHARGIEFHAWMNPYRISTNGTTSHYVSGAVPASNPVNNPENLIQVGDSIIFDPGIPEVRDFLVDTCMEVIKNYDIDAIHFDDYFYISGADDTATREKYNTENLSLGDFRRKQVDLFIEDLSKHIRSYNAENNKCVQLGISPSNVYQNGGYVSEPKYDASGNLTYPTYSNTGGFAHYGNYLYSDTLNWINNEWIDYIMPQCYHALENSAAPFADVVRWWSWAVRNKKVNFYAGLGIYMPLSSGNTTWLVNTNEVELQLLYAAQYPEFGGANFYKYSSLKSTYNEVVNDAVDTISNDFWKVRIPSAINKYYAPIMDEVQPTNAVYDSNTSSISYDEIENVRGYMVYKVPKGSLLDKTNIEHVYSYTQSTSIVVDDTANYDYYVSSVNLANEVSEATYVSIALGVQNVIDAINALPTNITYEAKAQIEQARTLYNSLSEENQAKVTNIDKLVSAEKALSKIDDVYKKLDNYISTLDLHIKESRTIPLLANMTIAYKNTSDSALYNLETGEKLKNYLSTKLITLILTLSADGIIATREVNFNIGLTPTDKTGLFYRNDPSAIGEDDEGEYGTTSDKWIGWSNHTITVESNILYVAYGNYIEINDSNVITGCHWPSCAGVYVNKTEETITMKMTDAFEKLSSNKDGYFIISDEKVKEVNNGFSETVEITLKSGEVLVIIRYLDGLLNGSPMSPVTKIAIGTKAYLDSEKEKTSEELAQEIIDSINKIPTEVTLADESFINEINSKYLALKEEAKALVTNYSILSSAISKLEELKQALEIAKQNAVDELKEYLDLDKYSDTSKNTINSYLSIAEIQINNATNTESIDSIVLDTKAKLDKVLTKEAELEEYKTNKYESLVNSIDLSLYSNANQLIITDLLEDAKNSIDEALTTEEVDSAIDVATNKISKVLTLKDEEELLNKTRQEYIQKMQDYIESLEVENEVKAELEKYKQSYIEQFNNATGDFDYVYSRFKDTVDSYLENLESTRKKAITNMQDYVASLKYSTAELEVIFDELEKAIELVNNTYSLNDINSIVTTFVNDMDTLHDNLASHKSSTILSLEELVLLHYTEKQVEYIRELIQETTVKIKDAGSISQVDQLKETLENNITSYISELNTKINEARVYFDSFATGATKAVLDLITASKKEVGQVKFINDVSNVILKFDTKYGQLLLAVKVQTSKDEINTYITSLPYDSCEIEVIQTMKQQLFALLDNVSNESEILNLTSKFKTDVTSYHNSLNETKKQAKSEVSGKIAINNDAKNLIDETIAKINNAAQISEVENILNTFNTEYNKIQEKNDKSCKKSTGILLLSLISISFGLIKILRKKNTN